MHLGLKQKGLRKYIKNSNIMRKQKSIDLRNIQVYGNGYNLKVTENLGKMLENEQQNIVLKNVIFFLLLISFFLNFCVNFLFFSQKKSEFIYNIE